MSTCARCGAGFSCAMVGGEEAAASRGLSDNVDSGVADTGNVASASPAQSPAPVSAAASAARCWCTYLPAAVALPSEPGGACWCPSCLQAHIAAAEGLRNGAK